MSAAPGDVITQDPLNVESSWTALREPITPLGGFYTRNNFAVPDLRAQDWRLDVRGFEKALALTYAELTARPSRALDVVLECAGNARTYFDPRPQGTPWRERAVGCATFRGAPLADLLDEAGVPEGTVEIVFRGADGDAFERSMPVEAARAEDVLLAWEMNGEPLRPRHGAPVRLVVPGWYGVASVKWLVEARASRAPFRGHFQAERYVYQRDAADPSPRPVREKRVNSLIASPLPDARVPAGEPLRVEGWAWSGHGAIARVEVSTDGGRSWSDATLGPAPASSHAWRGWSLTLAPREGALTLLARAHDAAGNVQPDVPEWNVHGYGYNAPRPRRVQALARPGA